MSFVVYLLVCLCVSLFVEFVVRCFIVYLLMRVFASLRLCFVCASHPGLFTHFFCVCFLVRVLFASFSACCFLVCLLARLFPCLFERLCVCPFVSWLVCLVTYLFRSREVLSEADALRSFQTPGRPPGSLIVVVVRYFSLRKQASCGFELFVAGAYGALCMARCYGVDCGFENWM